MVNNKENLDTVIYKSFEISNQDGLSNAKKNTSTKIGGNNPFQIVAAENQQTESITDSNYFREDTTLVIDEGIVCWLRS